MLIEGKKLPKIQLPDQSGDKQTISSLTGKKGIILYVYPKDNTPGCTVEAKDFSRLAGQFKKLGFSVVGLSKDSVESHQNFVEKYDLAISLLSDPDLGLIKALGAWGEKKLYGKVSVGLIRSTFIADSKGILLKVYPKVRAAGHADRVLKDLETLL